MALQASGGRMLSGKRERGLRGVIEGGSVPIGRGVALGAEQREPGRDVIRIVRALIVVQVTGGTGGAQRRVLAARMALLAGDGGVRAGQRESGRVVIERGRRPIRSGVAELAGLRKTGRGVIRAGGGLEIFQVAGDAIGADVGEVAVGVALQARHGSVRSGQGERRHAMVERSPQPARGVVAGGAIVRESRRHVIGVGGFGEVSEVTTRAVRRNALVAVAGVASVTGERQVRAGESEVCVAGMIETGGLPAVRRVAVFAGRRESGGGVIEDGVLLEIAQVATDTLRAESDVLPNCRSRVAGIARQRGMRADQRETIPVILNRAGIDAPAEHRMAAFALRAELALMEIGVTIGATRAGLRKDFRYVAGIARYVLMHAAQLEAGLGIVIELDARAKRRPARSGVTVLARKRKFTVRVGHIALCEGRQRYP